MFLLYLDAVFGLFFGALFNVIGLILLVGSALAALGIANEHRWGYWLGVAMAAVGLAPFVYFALADGITHVISLPVLFDLVLPVVLAVALAHPQSRDYQRAFFR